MTANGGGGGRRLILEDVTARLEGGGAIAEALARLGRRAVVEALGRRILAETRRGGVAVGAVEARAAADRIVDRLAADAAEGGR